MRKKMILGTWNITNKNKNVFEEALEVGFDFFDIAQIYNNESLLGQKDLSNKKVCSKIWVNNCHNENTLRNSIKETLTRLNLDTLYMAMIHFPIKKNNFYLNVYKWLEKLKDEGLIKNIGVSNYQIQDLKDVLKICKHKPLVNQIEYNPMCTQNDLMDFCHENEIEVQGYSIIKPWLKESKHQNFNDKDCKIINSLAMKYNKTPIQILIRWTIQRGIIPVIKSSNKAHFLENIAAADFYISSQDMSWINSINRNNYKEIQTKVSQYWNSIFDEQKTLLFKKNYLAKDL